MRSILNPIDAYIKRIYPEEDMYSILESNPGEIVRIARVLNLERLPGTCRSRNNSKQSFCRTDWKRVEVLLSLRQKSGELYSLVVSLGKIPLYRASTGELVRSLVKKHFATAQYVYTTEKGIAGETHIHLLVHLPRGHYIPKYLRDGGRRYPVKSEVFNSRYPNRSLQEGLVRFVRYLRKPKDAAYRSTREKRDAAFLEEVAEFLACERERVALAGSNLNTRKIGTANKQRYIEIFDAIRENHEVSGEVQPDMSYETRSAAAPAGAPGAQEWVFLD